MTNSIVFMFSGQGSQYFNMGRSLYERNPVFSHWMQKLDAKIADRLGMSVLSVLYDYTRQKSEVLSNIMYTYPAVFMTEYALAQTLMEDGIFPDYVMGASMGEFVSAAVSSVMDIEDIIDCIIRQAEVFRDCCCYGSMLAVMHSPDIFYSLPLFYKCCELAGINFDSHFVVSGTRTALEDISGYLGKNDIPHQMLPVEILFILV